MITGTTLTLSHLLFAVSLSLLAADTPPATAPSPSTPSKEPRPNILWITSEDNGAFLGCYGDKNANTDYNSSSFQGNIWDQCNKNKDYASRTWALLEHGGSMHHPGGTGW